MKKFVIAVAVIAAIVTVILSLKDSHTEVRNDNSLKRFSENVILSVFLSFFLFECDRLTLSLC